MAAEAALAFAPEIMEIRWEATKKSKWQWQWTICASDVILNETKDSYSKRGFREVTTRRDFDAADSGDHKFFLDTGELHVQGIYFFDLREHVLRPWLSAATARGLLPAAPAALEAAARAAPGPKVVDNLLQQIDGLTWPLDGRLRSLWLPRAPPARPASATPAGMASLRVLGDGAVTDVKMPEEVWAEVERLWPGARRDMGEKFERDGSCEACSAIFLAMFVSASHHCGYELVAPQAVAEQVMECLLHGGTDLGAKLRPLTLDSELLFLPKAVLLRYELTTTTTSMAVLRVRKDGVVTAFEAPQDLSAEVKQCWPEARRVIAAVFEKTGLCNVDNVILLAVFAASQHCGYELVAPKEVAEWAITCPHDGSKDFVAEFQLLAQDVELVFLPTAMPGTMAVAASMPVVRVRTDGALTDFEAPEDLRVEVEACFPALRGMLADVVNAQGPWEACNAILLATVVSAAQRCGYELVAPKEVAEQALPREHDSKASFGAELQRLARDAKLVFLPQGVIAATGEVVLHIPAGDIVADVQRIFTNIEVPPTCSHKVLLAWFVSVLDRSGYELVAPKAVAEQAKAFLEQGSDFSACLALLADVGIKAPLVFVQRAKLSADQRCILDVQVVEGYCPPGHATIEVNESGIPSLADAPREAKLIIEEAHPWVCQDVISRLQGASVDFAPRLLEVLAASATALGYKQVTAPADSVAGAYRFFQPSRPPLEKQETSFVAREALQAVREEFAAKLQAQAEQLQAQLQAEVEESARRAEEQRALQSGLREALAAQQSSHEALRAELMEALRAQREDAREKQQAAGEALEGVRSQAEQLQAQLQAKVEESARQAEEQRTLQRGLQEALAVQQSSHEALRAELVEALRGQREDAHEMQRAAAEALEGVRSQVARLADEQGPAESQDWPTVQISDADVGTAGAAKHIRIACPGADEDDITIEEHGNGVHVHIAASDQSRTEFDRDFCFDRCKDGFFELRQDECAYENGVLLLVLKRTVPKRMKLKLHGSHSGQRSSLATVVEEAQDSQSHGREQTTMYYDIASAHLEGSHDADSRSITSEARSWLQVGVDAQLVGPSSEQDARSVGKESLGEASQQSSWVIPSGAASLRLGASEAPSSCGSLAASVATVHSVASAPARGSTPCCFLPGTVFRSAETGKYVRAAELKRAGGDKLIGPAESQVLVSSAIKHAALERDLVSLRLRGVSGAFVVTADHQLLARGPKDQPVARSAGEFVQGMHLFDGANFHDVEQAKSFKWTSQVIEISFEGDAAALAWVMPRRSRSGGARIPVAVLGKEPTLGDRGVCEQRTFLDVPSSAQAASVGRRARSAGSRPAPGSSWSAGSRGHDDAHPEWCEVCAFHQLYLKQLRGPNGSSAEPCPEGAACRKCHAPHPEYRRGH